MRSGNSESQSLKLWFAKNGERYSIARSEGMLAGKSACLTIHLGDDYLEDYLACIQDEKDKTISKEDMAEFMMFNEKYGRANPKEKWIMKGEFCKRYEEGIQHKVPKSSEEAQQYLDGLWSAYEEKIEKNSKQPFLWGKAYLYATKEQSHGVLLPESHRLGSILLECKEQKGKSMYLCPGINSAFSCYGDDFHCIAEDEDEMEFIEYVRRSSGLVKLYEVLQMAFSAGKSSVVIPLSYDIGSGWGHAYVAVFFETGRFCLIDSMGVNSVSPEPDMLSRCLNKSQVKDKDGRLINFEGSKVNLRIQPSDNGKDCSRFATLIAYHIYKMQDIEAYKQVVGAFVDNQLKKFEDYKQIDRARKVDSVSRESKDDGLSYNISAFMEGWVNRSAGLTVHSWKDLTFSNISKLAENEVQVVLLDKEGQLIIEPFNIIQGYEAYLRGSDKKPGPALSEQKSLALPQDSKKTLGQLVDRLRASASEVDSATEGFCIVIDKSGPKVYLLDSGYSICQKKIPNPQRLFSSAPVIAEGGSHVAAPPRQERSFR